MANIKEYDAWRGMIRRCDPLSKNRRNQWHIRKGIKVCPEWFESFERFFADVGRSPTPKHTLERIDNDGNYEPGNVRWATAKEQANNRSGIRIRKITFNGLTMNLTEWDKHLGFAHGVVSTRIRILGWTIEEALTRPKHARKYDKT